MAVTRQADFLDLSPQERGEGEETAPSIGIEYESLLSNPLSEGRAE
jgi:hypothetical protein